MTQLSYDKMSIYADRLMTVSKMSYDKKRIKYLIKKCLVIECEMSK